MVENPLRARIAANSTPTMILRICLPSVCSRWTTIRAWLFASIPWLCILWRVWVNAH